MKHAPVPTKSPRGAARVMLFAMRAVLPAEADVRTSGTFLVAGQTIGEEEALQFLDEQPKPTTCGAKVVDGLVSVTCSPIGDRDRPRWEWKQKRRAASQEQLFGVGADRLTAPVLLRSRADSLLVSVADFQEWLRSYQLAGPYSMSIHDQPDDEARAIGATVVVKFGVGGNVEVRLYPPPD